MKNSTYHTLLLLLACMAVTACGSSGSDTNTNNSSNNTPPPDPVTPPVTPTVTMAQVGEKLFFDTNLSSPSGQSCATCHDPSRAFVDPMSLDNMTPTSEGVDAGVFGARNTPTALYARFIPTFSNNLAPKGGQFLDGRAATLEIQAEKPFENPLEMNNTKQGVIDAVKLADYADDFRAVFGAAALDNIDAAFTDVTKAIAAFERTATFAPLSSQFDVLGASGLTASAQNGLALFNGKADCARCHKSNTSPEVFADFGFHNIGVPGNPANPAVMDDPAFVDKGLGAVLNNSTHDGKLRTPTLRNVALTAPYMHNGVFNTLDEVMAFYNDSTRPTAEVAANVDADIGDLGLTTGEITDIINFLHALTDN